MDAPQLEGEEENGKESRPKKKTRDRLLKRGTRPARKSNAEKKYVNRLMGKRGGDKEKAGEKSKKLRNYKPGPFHNEGGTSDGESTPLKKKKSNL